MPPQKHPIGSSTRQMKLVGSKQQWDMWWERKLGEQQDLGAAGKADGRGREVEGETQERNRAADREGGRKHEQPQQGAKPRSLLSSGCIKSFPFSKFISFIQVSVPELWDPEDVCVLVMGRGRIGNYPHFLNFLIMWVYHRITEW